MLAYNAIILAGGRSARLEGTPKAGLSNGQQTLLASTLLAVEDAQVRLVVGPADLPLPAGVLLTREDPPFSGPAAAIAAGLSALPENASDWTLILSVDMPGIRPAVEVLCAQAESSANSELAGLMGTTDGVLQPLAGIYRTAALLAIAEQETANRSVRRWLGQLPYELCDLPAGSTQDVDTWEQAQQTGFTSPQW